MIAPVLNKESAVQELANMGWLLKQAKTLCGDSNLRWKIAEVAGRAEDVLEDFMDEFGLAVSNPEKNYKEVLEKLPNRDGLEFLLSFAYASGGTMDSANYAEFEPGLKFREKIKSITQDMLQLLQENKEWRKGEEE